MSILNKSFLITGISLALFSLSFCSQAATAPGSAQITVTATVEVATCTWVSGYGTQLINLGSVDIDALAAGAIEQVFELRLINCPPGRAVPVKVSGDAMNDIFKNQLAGSDAATGVGITIWNNYLSSSGGVHAVSNYTQVKNNGFTRGALADVRDGAVVIPLKAKLQVIAGMTPTAGLVQIPITMTVNAP